MTGKRLDRVTFSVSRAADFLDVRALESQTGQPRYRFADVVIKELGDDALDGCETAGVEPQVTITVEETGDIQWVTVEDNGDGIPADVVARILDYSTLTSDKALYRSPCRGAQGNALKTVFGIPHALGVQAPVVIEAQGVLHRITVGLGMAGEVQVKHEQEPSTRTVGTEITVPLPADLDHGARQWVQAYALVNPHATFTLKLVDEAATADPEIYKATAPASFRKPLPTDPTSPHWYDEAAFTRLIGSLAALGDDRPIGMFIREFAGLTSSAKARDIAAMVPEVERITDIAAEVTAGRLLRHMQDACRPPKPTALGQVPADHYEDLLDDLFGVDRFWYKHGGIVHNGVAWHIEVAVADTLEPGERIFAVNYGVSFGDPLGGTILSTDEIYATGSHSFLSQLDAAPNDSNQYRAAVVHVTCAAPTFLDKGKVSLSVPPAVAQEFGRVLWGAGKALYREAKAAERAEDREQRRAAAAERREQDAASKQDRTAAAAERRSLREAESARRARQITKREAVFQVIEEAIRQQRDEDDLPFSVHTLFYKIRPLALKLLAEGTKLNRPYVEQVLIPEWEREHGPISGMYRDPRGTLHEPHSGDEVRLGTREVRAYTPPEWTFNKILVVEKEGLWPVLEASRLAERCDMAIITSQGYSAEACRLLLAKMPPGDVQIFALHDADIDGYNIARTLGEATARMPDHSVDIIDLGLTIDAAIESGLESEEFTRERAIPETILPRLSPAALEWFTGEVMERDKLGQPKKWLCRRVELNAFLSRELIAYIEAGLTAHGATGKVIPPATVLRKRQRASRDTFAGRRAQDAVDRLIDMDSVKVTARRIVRRRSKALLKRGMVAEQFTGDRDRSWRQVVDSAASRQVTGAGVDFDRLVRWLVAERTKARTQ